MSIRRCNKMAKISGNYEAVFIIDPTLGEEETANLVAKFKALVEGNGTLTEVDEWGKRRLAYPINDYTEGYYVLISFSSVPSFPAEMDRIFKITDGIMRSMITCTDAK
jgi:small subunit ribosomal protein S6